MIKIENATYKQNDRIILNNVSINLFQKNIAIIGLNGSGKSTLIKLISGLIVPQQGSVFIEGLDTKKNAKKIRKKIGCIFQNPENQIVFPIVKDDILFTIKNQDLTLHEKEKRLNKVLNLCEIPHLKDNNTYFLSGGEKQLVAIASILIKEPSYVLFDEPASSLDLVYKKLIFNTIRKLNSINIVATHDTKFIENFSRVILMDKGAIIRDGNAKEIIDYYHLHNTSFIK